MVIEKHIDHKTFVVGRHYLVELKAFGEKLEGPRKGLYMAVYKGGDSKNFQLLDDETKDVCMDGVAVSAAWEIDK